MKELLEELARFIEKNDIDIKFPVIGLKKCPKCGIYNNPNFTYCKCGHKLKK